MGVALAAAGKAAGCEVTLLLGPVEIVPPVGVTVKRFKTAKELGAMLDEHFPACDGLIMAAAVSDYQVGNPVDEKLPRVADTITIELEKTPDLVGLLGPRKKEGQWIVGFALEEDHLLKTRALEKLERKQLDAIVANPLRTMGAGDVTATVYTAEGGVHEPGGMMKGEFAEWLIGWALDELGGDDGA